MPITKQTIIRQSSRVRRGQNANFSPLLAYMEHWECICLKKVDSATQNYAENARKTKKNPLLKA